ncbi:MULTISPECIES: DUF1573 domain-containing protein [Flavobacterium]|uniref:DUF1573 domain-containing protein n=1 Tax=Flavobacterium TaxID=237 RepID=UPI00095CDE8F|nr:MULTISPECIES: DUF1573 domain-containing protein [Flavobacterium]MBN9286123.1 DUF1573 domain-containing protein [Flavobacterium sp.]OJV68355.1 MAG: hypothetical protein BGO42_03980 [Flavobacterium sp. 40-81]
MINKTLGMLAIASLVLTTSCKKENASDKIDDASVELATKNNEASGKLPVIKFNEEEHNFGTINEGDKAETVFTVTNEGEADLIIVNAQGSCGCTVPEWPKEPIKPGASVPLKVTFDSTGKPGQQQKTVTLTTNTAKGTETVTIKAEVTPKAK